MVRKRGQLARELRTATRMTERRGRKREAASQTAKQGIIEIDRAHALAGQSLDYIQKSSMTTAKLFRLNDKNRRWYQGVLELLEYAEQSIEKTHKDLARAQKRLAGTKF